jgi:hypothetical protein
VFNKALVEAYKPGFADKVRPVVVEVRDVENCKLDFVDKFFLALKSLVTGKALDVLQDMKLASRIYKEIQHTREFHELASPEIGKTVAIKSHVAALEAQKASVPKQGIVGV